MASLVLGALGAWLAPVGYAGLGYSIGSSLGSMFGGGGTTKQYGPRLTDLKTMTSEYGNASPVVYGAMRVAGNVIWAADTVETTHVTKTKVKTGLFSKKTIKTYTYTYSQSLALALCEGTIQGIRRIWANNELIYDISSSAADSTIYASVLAGAGFVVYTGTEAQTADPTIAAHVGAANCPAYRGTAYIVFNNLQLEDFGNRAPNLEFEIVGLGAVAHPVGSSIVYNTEPNPSLMLFDPVSNAVWVATYFTNISKYNIYSGAKVDYPLTGASGQPLSMALDPVNNAIWIASAGGFPRSLVKVSTITGICTYIASMGSYIASVGYDPSRQGMWVGGYGLGARFYNLRGELQFTLPIPEVAGGGGLTFFFCTATQRMWFIFQNHDKVHEVNYAEDGYYSYTSFSTAPSPIQAVNDPSTNSVWMGSNNVLSKYNPNTKARTDYGVNLINGASLCYDSLTGTIWVSDTNSNRVARVIPSTGAYTNYTHAFAYGSYITAVPTAFSVWAFHATPGNIIKIYTVPFGLDAISADLAVVVQDICERAGLSAVDLDTDDLVGKALQGYAVQRYSARSQIEQLMQAFFFDAIESDGKIKFKARGGAPVATITEDDLAAHDYENTAPASLLKNRSHEMELPVEYLVDYADVNAFYRKGTQIALRMITQSQNKLSTSLAIAMSGTKAKEVADVLMYDTWAARTSFDFTAGWKWAHLEPTDIINLTAEGRTYAMRITGEDCVKGIFQRSAVKEDVGVYVQTAVAADPEPPTTVVGIEPLTFLSLLDIPLLDDADDGIGFYAAACGMEGDFWHGAELYKSPDDGASWIKFGDSMIGEAVIGSATTALSTFTGGNIFDEHNSVTVAVLTGTLLSEVELSVLNGANLVLVGNEIIQFKDALLIAANSYTLTGLLRGRRGTEWAMSTHIAGERFVLLEPSTTYLLEGVSAEYDQQRQYRAGSYGRLLEESFIVYFTHTAIALGPYPPVHLGGGRNDVLDIILNWVRRTRITGEWSAYSDVPIGEATEAYEVEIYSSNTYATLKRTITGIITPTTTYTSAQQVTDFGSNQSTLYFIVYQISAVAGRGRGTRGVI